MEIVWKTHFHTGLGDLKPNMACKVVYWLLLPDIWKVFTKLPCQSMWKRWRCIYLQSKSFIYIGNRKWKLCALFHDPLYCIQLEGKILKGFELGKKVASNSISFWLDASENYVSWNSIIGWKKSERLCFIFAHFQGITIWYQSPWIMLFAVCF